MIGKKKCNVNAALDRQTASDVHRVNSDPVTLLTSVTVY